MLEKAPATNADALVLDLEDSVPVAEKAAARDIVAGVLSTLSSVTAYVRVNGTGSGQTLPDIRATMSPALQGILLPKVQSPSDVLTVCEWLDETETANGIPHGQVEVICMIETAVGLRAAYEIASASQRVASLVCSSAENGDLQTDLGSGWMLDGAPMQYARSKIIVDARAAGISYPLDGVYARVADLEGLSRDSEVSRSLGYRGRTLIHPSHIDVVNRVYAPSADEIAYCRSLVAAFEAALGEGRASIAFQGKMVDYAMIPWAKRVLQEVESFGIEAMPA